MSETARKLFASMKEAAETVTPGLKDLWSESKAELSRLGTQGAMELASALFNGHGFVPYGPGQYTPSPDREHPAHEQGAQQRDTQERGMER